MNDFQPKENPMEKETLDRIARRRAGAKLGFYIHASVYLLANLGLYAINGNFTPSVSWHVWPLGGWGIGLAFHGLAVFLAGSGSGLRERMVRAERRRLESQLTERGYGS
jgi:hypothetical protein